MKDLVDCFWICNSVSNVHYFLQRTKAPKLVPEEADRRTPKGSFLQDATSNSDFIACFSDHLDDPRIEPSLILLALMLSSFIWLNKNRSTQTQSNNSQNESNQTKVH